MHELTKVARMEVMHVKNHASWTLSIASDMEQKVLGQKTISAAENGNLTLVRSLIMITSMLTLLDRWK